MAKPTLGVNQMAAHIGAVAQAVRLLRWWAEDVSDEPTVVEHVKQSKECARDLAASLARWKRAESRQ